MTPSRSAEIDEKGEFHIEQRVTEVPANGRDMVRVRVLDPAKVVRSALQNAASIAGLLLTTECIITDAPERDSKAPAGGGGGGGMGGMGGGMDY